MDKYSRYKDDQGRVFILLAKYSKVNIKNGDVKLEPTTVELLDVGKEALVPNITVEKMQEYIDKKLLVRIT